jgi:hypothetical protein
MGIKKVLGSISPLAGAITGEGMFGGLRKISPVMMAIDALKDKKKAGAKGVEAKGVGVEDEEVAVEGMKRGGAVKKMANGGPMKTPSARAAVDSGNRISKMEGDEARFMGVGPKPKKKTMPSIRDSVDSGNRMSRLEGAEMRKMKYAKGGSASSRADGCATKGKTKGRMV